MEKKEALEGLVDLRNKANAMWIFKGKAALIKDIEKSIDFIRVHKMESKIAIAILNERQQDYERGVKTMDEKYKEEEPDEGPG